MIKKVFIVLFLSFLLLFAALSSCGENEGGSDKGDKKETGGSENQTDTGDVWDKWDNLPKKDYGGYDFRIYVRESPAMADDFYAEADTAEVISDAVYSRNKLVEEKFNVNLVPVFYPDADQHADAAKKMMRAGDDFADLVAMHGGTMFKLAGEGFALDWLLNMPHINFGAPWWPEEITKNFSAFGKLYCMTGDISHSRLNRTMCFLFNKELFKDLNIDYPYNDVTKGTWTFDRFASVVRQGKADLDGDGQITHDRDRWGMENLNEWTYAISVLYSGGDKIITVNDDGSLELTIYSERTLDIYDKFFELVDTGSVYIGNVHGPGWAGMFRDGRSLLFSGLLEGIIEYRNMEQEIGILPLPKYDESTPKYYANVEGTTNMLVIPVTSPDPERTSVIVEALCAEGYRLVMPALYDVALKTKFARDEESALMLDYIKDGIMYDYGYYDNTLVPEIAYTGVFLVRDRSLNFTSFYEKRAPAIQKNIDRLNQENR